jgi:SAM-dependent methyltransferase
VITTPPDFEQMYADDPDPWRVATSWYEQRKLGIVLAALRRPAYRWAWDAGCGTGELAVRLAPRCDAVLATDLSARAVELTRRRADEEGMRNISVQVNALPLRPSGLSEAAVQPDLIILSEFLYYLDADQRAQTWRLIEASTAPEADVVAVHWRPKPEDAWLSGEAVQRELNDYLTDAGWCRVVTHTDVEFVVATWSRDVPLTIGR